MEITTGSQTGLQNAIAFVSSELQMADHRLLELTGSNVPRIPAITEHLLKSGGKRLRPLLTALGCRSVGFSQHAPDLMAIGELIHTASLLHDDVVDDALIRRGRAAAHRIYGDAAVILTGDYCLGRALLLASDIGAPVVKSLAAVITEMAEGEILQLESLGFLNTSLENYFRVIEKKSASLIAWCVSVGARMIGDDQSTTILQEFGRRIGIAFQIADDVADYQMPMGDDPVVAKVNLPLLLASFRVETLREHIEAAGEINIPMVVDAVRTCGALTDSLATAREHVEAAVDVLNGLQESEARASLIAVARSLVQQQEVQQT